MTYIQRILSAGVLTAALGWSSAQASTITINGVDHDESAFVDEVTLDSGVFTPYLAPTPEEALVGGDVLTAANCDPDAGPCSFTAYFTDNVAVNGDGDDIVLYALGGKGLELFDISINGVTSFDQAALRTGEYAGPHTLLAYYIDLDLFGIAAGAAVSSFAITTGIGGPSPEDFAAFAALNNEDIVMPIPGAAWLFGSALVAGGVFRRKRKAS